MNILKRPIVTEKTLAHYKNNKQVTFEVDQNTDKIAAAKMLEKVYAVKVKGVKVISRLGKYKYNRLSRKINKVSDKKLMIFSLTENDKIDIFEA